ncbi:uncharacterized protein RHOBADRAFT_52524 [Rhodotorula graminis WP1]|uniref:F-box domain-containing protein n=1 Tax=Rhodotorula graminis (strain WP1) TaxID=578459 RepID=A0A194SAV1_RHOGW|nr:uncharacterized protein RHOBADRAFT_52524 [Rhodotorula graminis WP1]KPV76526.1 hypothetical protein RHOBADRAFT_52524 [Rhodotorula graminis WP1]
MACLASLPPELLIAIVEAAAGPVTYSGSTDRRDTLLRLSLVGPLRHAAQQCLARAVHVRTPAHLEAVRRATSAVHLQFLYLDNSDVDFTVVSPRYRLDVAVSQALRAVALILLDGDLDLDPLAALPELEDLRIDGCIIIISPHVVFDNVTRLEVCYTVARKEHKDIFISSSCMPRLRHMRSIHHEGEDRPYDMSPYLRPNEALVQQLVTLEYNYIPAIEQYDSMGDSECRTLYAVDLAVLPAFFVGATSSASKVRHVRLEPPKLHNVNPHITMQLVEENLRRISWLIENNAPLVADLRTLLLPTTLRDLPALLELVKTVETSSKSRNRTIKVYFSNDSGRDVPLGQPTLFMHLAEHGGLDG